MKKSIASLLIGAAITSGSALAEPVLSNVIVSLKPDMNAHLNTVLSDYQLVPSHTYHTVFSGFAASLPNHTLELLKSDPRVASISPDTPVKTTLNSTLGCGLLFNCEEDAQVTPWGVSRIGANVTENTGAGVHVYVIDTGIDSNHPDLAANLGNGYSVEMCIGLDCRESWDDDQGHGTHVAGTIGARNNNIDVVGVAPEVTLHAVKVLNAAGSGSNSGVIAGIDWVATQAQMMEEAVIANMSLGGSGSKTGTCTESGFNGNDNLHRAVCNAKNAGVIFAVAAGNDGADAEGATPAAYDDAVITVSATNANDDWASWSNWGNNSIPSISTPSAPVAIAAPGADILSLKHGGGTTSMSGTSMASPHVAGALALFLKDTPQSRDASAFTNALQWVQASSESNANFSNTTGKPHSEQHLSADMD